MTFREILIELSKKHIKFKGGGYADLINIDLFNKKVSNGKVILMDKGKIIPQTLKLQYGIEYELTEDMRLIDEVDDFYSEVENLYQKFKYSIPEPYEAYAKNNFVAVKLNDLTREQFNNGIRRQQARIELESLILLSNFEWKNDRHHYYQGNDKNLILYKEWR